MAEDKTEDSLELVEETPENNSDEVNTDDSSSQDSETTNEENNEQEFGKKKKKNILKLALFGVIGLLGLVLISGIVMYFLGVFDAPIEEKKVSKKTEKKEVVKENYKFDIKEIDTSKLNKQLAQLTNKRIKENQEIERLEKLEEEKAILEKERARQEKALKEAEGVLSEEKMKLENKKEELEKQKAELETLKKEALLLKEQMIQEKVMLEEEKEKLILNQINLENTKLALEEKNKEEIIPKENKVEVEGNIQNTDTAMMEEKEEENTFLLLINVATIKGNLYKDYLDSITSISSDVKLCRDDVNNIEVYFGPFENKTSRKSLFNALLENNFDNAFEVELTKEEFNKRCNY